MQKIKRVIIGIISAMCIMMAGVGNNIESFAAEFSKNITFTEQSPDNVMLLAAGTYSTALKENRGTFYIGTERALELDQKVKWTYGGATGKRPIISNYDFTATVTTGYVYAAITTKLREDAYVYGKEGTRYTEKGICSGKLGSTMSGLYVECNYDGGCREGIINKW